MSDKSQAVSAAHTPAMTDAMFLRDLAARMFKTVTPTMGFDQGCTDQLYRIARGLSAPDAARPDAGEGGRSWPGDPHRASAELRRVANVFKPGFRIVQLLRDAADEIDCLASPTGRAGDALLVPRATPTPAAPPSQAGEDAAMVERRTALLDYAMHYGPRCRECGDHDGVCPVSNMPCGHRRQATEFVIDALFYGATYGHCPAALTAPSEPAAGERS